MLTKEGQENKDLNYTSNAASVDSGYALAPPIFSLTSSAPPTKTDALQAHHQNINKVEGIVSDMETNGTDIEKNSAEWIRMKEVSFFVGTRTHDSVIRGQAMHQNPDDLAYFGANDSLDTFPSPNANYDENNLRDYTKCIARDKGTTAIQGKDYFALLDPIANNLSNQEIKENIVHEVQHTADRHNDSHLSGAKTDVNKAWHAYKSEFRSYWLSGEFDQYSPHTKYGRTGCNLRQWEIYMHISREYGYVDTFKNDVVTDSENTDEAGKTMLILILDYHEPEGVNLENSLRIENLLDALNNCTPSTKVNDPEGQELLKSIDALRESEKESIFFSNDKEVIYQEIKNDLDPELSKAAMRKIAGI